MTKLLILIVVVLGILAVAQLARVYELTSRLRGKREEDISTATASNRMEHCGPGVTICMDLSVTAP